jgi:hypothetical protein
MDDSEKLVALKELLLQEDRVFANQILQKLDQLEQILYTQKNLSEKVDPIIDEKINAFVEKMPQQLGPVITATLREEIQNSQDQVVEVLFPIIGKMIKKYVQAEMKMLSDAINNQLQESFSMKKWKRKFIALFTGVSENDIILSELDQPQIQQVFVIEKGSGIILSSFSKTQTIDEDMVAGMLTAIKSFVEDAFQGGGQNLEHIEYELYKIHLQNFSSYYIAAVVSGSFNNQFKSILEDKLIDFASKHIKSNTSNKDHISKNLIEYFEHE